MAPEQATYNRHLHCHPAVAPRYIWEEELRVTRLQQDTNPLDLSPSQAWTGSINYLQILGPSSKNTHDNRAYLVQVDTEASVIYIPVESRGLPLALVTASDNIQRNHYPKPTKLVKR